jgi:hypothetical protein
MAADQHSAEERDSVTPSAAPPAAPGDPPAEAAHRADAVKPGIRRCVPVLIALVYLILSLWGLNWGVYSPAREAYLFPDGCAWSPERVAQVRSTALQAEGAVAADVDPDPLPTAALQPLNDDEARIAEVYSRFLLYSAQPDEMITFRALARMDPAAGKFDPGLYQYGGLFIYPLAALIKLAALGRMVTLAGEDHYLTHPGDFAHFYLIARGMVVVWGLLGVLAAGAVGSVFCDKRGGMLAALLFALLPVVISLSHEAKPHLPGAALMLWATFWALRYFDSGRMRHALLAAAMCGLACGMILSSVWIVALIPLMELIRPQRSRAGGRIVLGLVVAAACYAATNPYVLINLFTNPDLLMSNLRNSGAMYDLGNPLANLRRGWVLMAQGSSLWIMATGLAMLVALWGFDWRRTALLAVPALLVCVQFFALAANKPGEYGRFAVLPCAVLAMTAAAGTFRFLVTRWYQYSIYGLALTMALSWQSLDYIERFWQAETAADSRYVLAGRIAAGLESPNGSGAAPQADHLEIGLLRDPAPYACPPMDFSRVRLTRLPQDVAAWPQERPDWPPWLIVPVNGVEGVDLDRILADGFYRLEADLPADKAALTWAARPVILLRAVGRPSPPPEAPAAAAANQ